ncbi:MAG: heme o synthase [Bradymonadia bacterium]
MSATITSQSRARDFAALVKPSITLLSVFTMLAGLWLAPGSIDWMGMTLAVIGTALVVAAANALNCYIERDSDKFMARTSKRPLPAGRMVPKTALIFGLALAVTSVPVLVVGVNAVTGLLAAIALVSYVWVYTPMKQLSPWALWVGAVPGAMPPLLGWTAVRGQVEWPGLVLFGIMFIWQLPHFIAISMYRDSEYQRAGIRTVTAVHGWSSSIRQIFFWTAVLVPFSLLLVPLNITGTIYMASAGVLGFIFVVKAMQGFRAKDASLWARSLFLYSLVYLTLLFAAVAVDVLIARG